MSAVDKGVYSQHVRLFDESVTAGEAEKAAKMQSADICAGATSPGNGPSASGET